MCKKTYFLGFAAILFVALCAVNTNAQVSVTVTYSSDGSGTITIPDIATGVNGQLWGAGGGGGGTRSSGSGLLVCCRSGASGGGGAGGCIITGAVNTGTLNVVVGTGGAGGAGGNNNSIDGANGGNSSIDNLIAYGGGGAISQHAGGGDMLLGPAGVNPNCTGRNGSQGKIGSLTDITACGGIGGGSSHSQTCVTGTGQGVDGAAGTFPGGGGGGGASYSGTVQYNQLGNGGKGANGQVIITFTLPKPVINAPALICTSGTLSIQNPSSNTTYNWYLNGTYKGTGTSISASEAGNWSVTATYSIAYSGLTPTFNTGTTLGSARLVDIASDAASVTIKQPTEYTVITSICEGDTYTCLETGADYSAEGIYTLFTTTNAAGCDSVVKLNLSFKESINAVTIDNKSFDGACSGIGFEVPCSLPAGTTFTWVVTDNEELNESTPQSGINLNITNDLTEAQLVVLNVTATDICGNTSTFDVDVTVKPEPQPISSISIVRGDGYLKVSWKKDENAVGYILTVSEIESEDILLDGVTVTELPYIIDGDFDFTVIPYTFTVVTDYGCAQSQEYVKEVYDNTVTFDIPVVDTNKITVWTNNGELYFINDQNGDITIYTVVGVKIATIHTSAGKISKIALPQGIYLLQSGSKTIKVIL